MITIYMRLHISSSTNSIMNIFEKLNYVLQLKFWQWRSCNYCIQGCVNIADNDVLECSCGYMAPIDAATPNSVITGSILDKWKLRVNLHVNLDQIDASCNLKS